MRGDTLLRHVQMPQQRPVELVSNLPFFQHDHVRANVAKTTLYRVFNSTWTMGGRFYGPWPQSVPKEYRPDLLMDGQPTVEPDYRELHPTLLYALEGKRLDGGAYDVDGWPRRLVKVAFNVVLNASNKTGALRAVALEVDRHPFDLCESNAARRA